MAPPIRHPTLDQVSLKVTFGEEEMYYYAINVVMETVDEEDVTAWINGTMTSDGKTTDEPTDDGKDLLKFLSDRYTKITDDMNNEVPPAKDYDNDDDGYLDEEELEEWLQDLDGIIKGGDGKYYRPRPDLDGKGGKGDIYEEVDENGDPLDPPRIIDSGDDNTPGTADDEEWTEITDEMNSKEPPARDYDEDNKGYLTPDELEEWENAVEEEAVRKSTTPISLSATTNGASFLEGDMLTASDIEVTVTYEDGTTKLLTNEFDWTPKTALNAGTNTIEVSYTETPAAAGTTGTISPVTVTTTMTVTAQAKTLESIQITNPPDKTTYIEDETFDPTGMVVAAVYDNNTNESVTDYTWSPDGALATTDTTITVSYTENGVTKTATVGITVQRETLEQIADTETYGEVTDSNGNVWIVMENKTYAGTALLFSKEVVDYNTWDRSYSSWGGVGCNWSESRIRSWLNSTYRDEQLAGELKDNLVTQTKSTNVWNEGTTTHGDVTQDDVYLLSFSEYQNFEAVYPGDLYECATADYWWTRTPAVDNGYGYAISVKSENGVTAYMGPNLMSGVRPVLTVRYK